VLSGRVAMQLGGPPEGLGSSLDRVASLTAALGDGAEHLPKAASLFMGEGRCRRNLRLDPSAVPTRSFSWRVIVICLALAKAAPARHRRPTEGTNRLGWGSGRLLP
jgi:hypothetical protein